MTAHDAASGPKGCPCCDKWIELERSLAERYVSCNDGAATPSNILLAVLNAVADANRAARNRHAQVEVTVEMVERLAKHMCREEWKHQAATLDEMLDHMAKWQRYKPEACAALQAALGNAEAS